MPMRKLFWIALILMSACAPSKKKIIFDAIYNKDGSIEFKRNRRDYHDNFPGDVFITGYENMPYTRGR